MKSLFYLFLLQLTLFTREIIADQTIQTKFKKLTIITDPIGQVNKSGGHHAVTRSLLTGLQKIGVNFNYNPHSINEVGDYLYVLSDSNALIQGIELRKKGIIQKLLAGPNIMVRSNEFNHLLASPEIDTYIVNSQWTYNAYIEDESSLKNRLQIWPAGVDVTYWDPISIFLQDKIKRDCKKILVYWKTEGESFCKLVEASIKSAGFEPVRIKYGAYKALQFKNLLQESLCVVFISRTESQGIALAEAWSMDVPTLVWDPQEPFTFSGKTFWPINAAPYLCEENGILWKNQEELQSTLSNLGHKLKSMKPREWAVKHMSDEVCAKHFLSIMNENSAE